MGLKDRGRALQAQIIAPVGGWLAMPFEAERLFYLHSFRVKNAKVVVVR